MNLLRGGQGPTPFYLALCFVLAYAIYLLAQRPVLIYGASPTPTPLRGGKSVSWWADAKRVG